MQRPRNRQGRQRGSDRGGRGVGGWHSRGGRDRGAGSSSSTNVPSASQVASGAHVSIVLKIDQPTGCQVQGTVADVLTSGNHPRGIKVRLNDGRVGRVQKMVTEEEAMAGSEGLVNLGRNGETSAAGFGGVSTVASHPTRSNFGPKYRDVRAEDDYEAPPTGYSLGDFLPSNHPLQDRISQQDRDAAQAPSDVFIITCPVCNVFEGDEGAVAHHVNSHFD